MALFTLETVKTHLEATMQMLLARSPHRKLSLAEFREACSVDVAASEDDRGFWRLMHHRGPLSIDDATLAWCGYSGDAFAKKGHFKELLVRHGIPFREEAAGTQKLDLVVAPEGLYEALMLMTTYRGPAIRRTMCDFKKLTDLYRVYDVKFNAVCLDRLNARADEIQRQRDQALADRQRSDAEERAAQQRARRNASLADACLGSLRTVTGEFEKTAANATVQPADRRLRSALAMFLIAEPPPSPLRAAAAAAAAEEVGDDGRRRMALDGDDDDDDDSRETVAVAVATAAEQAVGRAADVRAASAMAPQNRGVRYSVYTTRRQSGKLSSVLVDVARRNPRASVTELVRFDPEPNGTNLYIRVKEFFRGRGTGVLVRRNTLLLGATVTPTEFLDIVLALRAENAEGAALARSILSQRHLEYVQLSR